MRQIKLYSFSAALALVPLADVTVSGIWDYMRGMEFRAFMAEMITQVVSGVTDALIITVVSSLFSTSA